MQWKLGAAETAGVIGVGLGLAWATAKVADAQSTPGARTAALLVGGASVYTLGVVIGTQRPPQGWLPAAGSRKRLTVR